MFTSIENRENNSYVTKMLTFSTSGPDLRDNSLNFRKIILYSQSLLTQDHVHVFSFRFNPILRKLESPPENDVSNKPLTPPDAPHSSDHFDVSHESVR